MVIEIHAPLPNALDDGQHAQMVGKILGYLAEARRADIEAKFRVGDVVHAMRYSHAFGRDAVRMLAESIALEQSGLLRIARVAERIRREERETLLSLVNARGLPLTWSHIEVLQHVRSVSGRVELARIALRDELSVRDLQRRIREGKSPHALVPIRPTLAGRTVSGERG